MSNSSIQKVADAEQVSRAAAEEFSRLAQAAIARRGEFAVAFSGGSTPKRLYQILSEAPFVGRIDWHRVQVFWGDERSVPPDHADSNYRMAREALLQKITIPAANVHRLQADAPDREAAARGYQEEIARVFKVSPDGPPPAFDLVLLGMGPDGHTASLFPQTTALKETKRWVVPNYVPKFSTYRLTLTTPILNRADEVLFLVAGADKATPLREVIEGPPDSDRLPSQLIRPQPGRLVWLVDEAAGSQLKSTS